MIRKMAKILTESKRIRFQGLYTHCGSSYDAAIGYTFQALCESSSKLNHLSNKLIS